MSRESGVVCSGCGKQTSGNFCDYCGTALGRRFCTTCGSGVTGTGRFCSECGSPLKGGAGKGAPKRQAAKGGAGNSASGDVSWWIAGGSLLVVVALFGYNALPSNSPSLATGGVPVPVLANPTGPVTLRQTADDLFNRVMTAVDNGDALTRDEFLPLAIQAYDAARPLDMDGVFHMALLHGAAGDHEASLASAAEILEAEPNHILGLVAAAKAAQALGRDDEAAGYYQRILDNHDAEIARPLMEYQTHSRYFGVARNEAQAFLAGR